LLLSFQSSSINPFSPIIPLIPSAQASLGVPHFLLPDGRHFITSFGSFPSSILTLNVKGIRNKTGEIIKGLEELRQDITILTETKKKGIGFETLGPYLHFYSGVPKEKKTSIFTL
jgi:hypothetical protein